MNYTETFVLITYERWQPVIQTGTLALIVSQEFYFNK